MDRQMAEALDRYITGNYGEDSLSDHHENCGFYDPDRDIDCLDAGCNCWCHRDDPEETAARLAMLEEEA